MQKRNRPPIVRFLVALLALVLLAWLARQVSRGATMGLDTSIRDAIHGWACPPLTWAMRGVTELAAPVFLIALGLLLVWHLVAEGRRRAAVMLTVVSLGAEGLYEILKLVLHRPRPEAFFGFAEPLTYSFPSGHSENRSPCIVPSADRRRRKSITRTRSRERER